MTALDLVIRARRAVTASGEMSCCVGVLKGRIVAVEPPADGMQAEQIVDLADDVVLIPGLVDTHVHVNEPGRTDWEGFRSATLAAAAGGVTTLVDMPLNSIPPTVDVEALELKRQAAAGRCFVDVGFWAGAVPGNGGSLRELHEAGVFGFKCFLVHSGVDEFPPLNAEDLEVCIGTLADLDALTLVHAEDAHVIADAPAVRGRSYLAFLRSRPRAAENNAVAHVVDIAGRTGARVHVVHLSSAEAVPTIRAARERGVRVSAETCPHYLTFAAEDIDPGATEFKCAPPIRHAENRERLWNGLRDGRIASVVSDHSPCTADLKAGSFFDAWGGIASVQLGLRAVWTQARARGFGLEDMSRWMSEGPAAIAGLERKGSIAEGKDADLVLFELDEVSEIDPSELQHRNPVTPYAGRRLDGRVAATYVRGVEVYADGRFRDEPAGRLLSRGAA
jgi:allantoinase